MEITSPVSVQWMFISFEKLKEGFKGVTRPDLPNRDARNLVLSLSSLNLVVSSTLIYLTRHANSAHKIENKSKLAT